MATSAKKARAYGLMVAGGDVWAWVIDRFHQRARAGLANANSLAELWPDQKAHGPFGELTAHCAQDVTKAWSAAFFEATRRRKAGGEARLPLKKHRLVAVRWRTGEFRLHPAVDSSRFRIELSTRRGTKNLVLGLAISPPYDPASVREVRLVDDGGELFVHLTARVAINTAEVDPAIAAGVDLGVIHPLAVSVGEAALLVSGRAQRAEEFLHLKDTKSRHQALARKRSPKRATPDRPALGGSRRWRKTARRQRAAEAKNRRVSRLVTQQAANLAVGFITHSGAGRVAIGDPRGVTAKAAGNVHNRRTHRMGHRHGHQGAVVAARTRRLPLWHSGGHQWAELGVGRRTGHLQPLPDLRVSGRQVGPDTYLQFCCPPSTPPP
jgi:transposase